MPLIASKKHASTSIVFRKCLNDTNKENLYPSKTPTYGKLTKTNGNCKFIKIKNIVIPTVNQKPICPIIASGFIKNP